MSLGANSSINDDRSRLLHNSSKDHETPNIITPDSSFGTQRSSPPQPRQRPGYSRLTSTTPDSQISPFNDVDIGVGVGSQGLGITPGHRRTGSLGSDIDDLESHDHYPSRTSVKSLPFSFSSTTPINESFHPLHKAKTSEYGAPSGASIRSRKTYADFTPHVYCASREHIEKGAGHYIYITLIVLGLFSTIFSGIFLGIAIAQPRYGKFISDGGNLTYSDAQILFPLFAKLIELSFVTVFIAFIGQVISRRAFNRDKSHGVSLAEITMRGLVMQPGQMLVNPQMIRYGVASLLGVLVILAALTAMLYTTAASALVSPQLMPTPFKETALQGVIANGNNDMTKIEYSCAVPLQNDSQGISQIYQTCVGPQFSAQSLHDWSTWLRNWAIWANATNGTDDLRSRPGGYSLVDDTTQASATWIEIHNMTDLSNSYKRVVNNVSLAYPHGAVIDSVRNPENGILQPKANDGFGAYNVHASVFSPAINVVCAGMTAEELVPMIYSNWSDAQHNLAWSDWANLYANNSYFVPSYGPGEWLNRTVVDEIFGFGPEFGQRRPPVFPVLPPVYNTLANTTGSYSPLWYRDAVYILGANPDAKGNLKDYSLCQLRAFRSSACSTWFNATSSSSSMSAICEDEQDPMQFSKRAGRDLPSGNDTTSLLWVDVGDNWATAVSLNDGAINAASSNARLLTEFFPTSYSLDPMQPSMAEALAVMAGGTLMLGSRTASTSAMTDEEQDNAPTSDTFLASIQSTQYGSGPGNTYQNLFYIILAAVFGGNILALTWLILNRGLVTDFCDPANLFSLTINSPPSHIFAGSCGGGPEGKQYQVKWFVNVDNDHVFIENDEQEHELAENRAKAELSPDMAIAPSPIMQSYKRLSKRRTYL